MCCLSVSAHILILNTSFKQVVKKGSNKGAVILLRQNGIKYIKQTQIDNKPVLRYSYVRCCFDCESSVKSITIGHSPVADHDGTSFHNKYVWLTKACEDINEDLNE